MLTAIPKIEWKRTKKNASGSRYWESRCGRYKVTASEMCYGIKLRPIFSAWFLASIPDLGGHRTSWQRISEHRKQEPAQAACQAHQKRRYQEDE